MRSRRAVAALLLSLATLVVVAAGCGGGADAKNAYVEKVQVAQRAFVARFEQVRGRLTATSTLPQDRATLGDFAQATAGFVTALRRAMPPSAVRDQHGRLVAAVLAYQRQVERAEKRLSGGSVQQRAQVRTELSSSVERTQAQIAQAIADINKGLRG